MILDTNALSAFLEGKPSVVKKLGAMTGVPHLPVIVLGEFRFGLPVTETTARHYAEIRHHLKKAGTPIPQNDAWIAALAWELNMPVLTDDTHFDHIPALSRIPL